MGTGGKGYKAPALQLEKLLALGLDQRTAENTLVNSKVTANLAAVIAEVKLLCFFFFIIAYSMSSYYFVSAFLWCKLNQCHLSLQSIHCFPF